MLSPEQARRDEAAAKLVVRDRALAQLAPALVAAGNVAGGDAPAGQSGYRADMAPDGGPRLIFDLPMPCHKRGCGVQLQAMAYHAFVNEGRFMLWIEGVCPRCMEKRKTVFDPMVGMQAEMKLKAEAAAMVAEWAADLTGDATEVAEEKTA